MDDTPPHTLSLSLSLYIYIYIYIYLNVYMHVSVRARIYHYIIYLYQYMCTESWVYKCMNVYLVDISPLRCWSIEDIFNSCWPIEFLWIFVC